MLGRITESCSRTTKINEVDKLHVHIILKKMADIPLKSNGIDLSDNTNTESRKGCVFQYFVAFSATLLMVSGGISSGWPSPSLPKLMANDSYIPITSDESSWIITTTITGTALGTLPAAWLMDRFGRKNAMLLCTLPYFIGWILIGIADSILYLFIGRFCLGLGFGWTMSVTPVYLGEIASAKMRGSLGTLFVIMDIFGVLYAYSIGPYVSISIMAWICTFPIILFLTTFIWLPESPYYFLGTNNLAAAEMSLSRLRGSINVTLEVEKITYAVRESEKTNGQLKELFTKNNRYRLFIMICLIMALHFTGCQAILSYTETIFRKMNSSIDARHASIMYVVLQLISATFSSLVIDSLGRRPLLLLSLAAIGICNSVIGFYFLFEKLNYDVSHITFVPVGTLMCYIIFYTFGVGSVPYIILGEIFPKNVKSMAALVFVMTASVTAVTTVKFYQIISDNLGNQYAFFTFSINSYIFLTIFWYFLPETKGKSLDMILMEFN